MNTSKQQEEMYTPKSPNMDSWRPETQPPPTLDYVPPPHPPVPFPYPSPPTTQDWYTQNTAKFPQDNSNVVNGNM